MAHQSMQDFLKLHEKKTRSEFENLSNYENLTPSLTMAGVMKDVFYQDYRKLDDIAEVYFAEGNYEAGKQASNLAQQKYNEFWKRSQTIASLKKDSTFTRDQLDLLIQGHARDILRIAHEAIKTVYGGQANCKNTNTNLPLYHTINIVDIIWEGRNQAEHYRDIKPLFPPTCDMFNVLASHDQRFANYNQRQTKAYDIIDLLGWHTYENYVQSMSQFN